MTQEFFTLTLSDLETLISKSSCSCHFINPNKTRLILWKEIQNGIETYYLRIGVQKFVSYPLKDKNKCPYWKFNPYEKLIEIQKPAGTSIETKLDAISKFHQRQARTNYGKSDNFEQSIDSSLTP